uniref:Uncharacterized protein n=1 Tax=Rhizophora mucronata TaxID=61149 RepID=A0A2P2QVV7_RHIMU
MLLERLTGNGHEEDPLILLVTLKLIMERAKK